MLLEPREPFRLAVDPSQGMNEIDGVGSGERSQRRPGDLRLAAELFQGAPRRRGIRQFLLPAVATSSAGRDGMRRAKKASSRRLM